GPPLNGCNSPDIGPDSVWVTYAEAGLADLSLTGGQTPTISLGPDSFAVDAGDDAVLGPPYNLSVDQTGAPRLSCSDVDIGATEAQCRTNTVRWPFVPGPVVGWTTPFGGKWEGTNW